MKITAQMVKELREKTGAGMLDCKKALQENNGDMEASIDWLREKGIAKAAKKASRIAAEGLTKIIVDGNDAVIVEVNSETDFVAKNETFVNLINDIATHLLATKPADLEAAMATTINGISLEQFMAEATAQIGEKITLRRFEIVSKDDNAAFGAYSHMGGKIGALLVLNETTDAEAAKDVAMHVAAMNPTFITRDEVSEDFIARETAIQTELTKNDPKLEGKPEKVLAGIIDGKVNKQLKEIVMVDQAFVKEPGQTVGKYIESIKAVPGTVIRYGVGEGIEKKEDNFAEEVMSQVNG